MKDLYNKLAVVNLLEPTALAHADQTSNILDTQGFDAAMIIAHVGALTGQDGSNYTVPTLQECDTTVGTSFTAVAAADMRTDVITVDGAADDSCCYKWTYLGTKRYIRILYDTTSAGTYPTGYVSAIGVLGDARHGPATAPAPVTAT
jgi:pectate lyase